MNLNLVSDLDLTLTLRVKDDSRNKNYYCLFSFVVDNLNEPTID